MCGSNVIFPGGSGNSQAYQYTLVQSIRVWSFAILGSQKVWFLAHFDIQRVCVCLQRVQFGQNKITINDKDAQRAMFVVSPK